MFVDLPENQLRTYRSSQFDPADFDEFWTETLSTSRSFDLNISVIPVTTDLTMIDVFDVSFSGFDGQRVSAWLRVPAGAVEPLPAVVQFHGYGRGRGDAIENLLWASAGFAHFEMDTRGQAWSGSRGVTADPVGSGPQVPGFLTKGIESRESYYYRRVFVDAVRAVEATRSLERVDISRVGVMGVSQGGGIALAVSGLIRELPIVVARVPFLCDFPRAIVITDSGPFREIGDYLAHNRGLASRVSETLAYFDGVNFAKRATAPLVITTALMDPICPPSTVFAAFNNYAGEKEITVWPYNAHEGGGIDDDLLALRAFRKHLGSAQGAPPVPGAIR